MPPRLGLYFAGNEPMLDHCVCFRLLFASEDDLGHKFILLYGTFSSADASCLLIPINRLVYVGPKPRAFIYSMFIKDTLDEKGQTRDTRVHVTLERSLIPRRILPSPMAEIASCSRTGSKKVIFPKAPLTKKGPQLNVLIHDKISFLHVAHWTRGCRSCSWALYRSPPCTIVGS